MRALQQAAVDFERAFANSNRVAAASAADDNNRQDMLRLATEIPMRATGIHALAAAVVARIEAVYRPEYVAECAAREPDSLLGLVVRLKAALASDGAVHHDRIGREVTRIFGAELERGGETAEYIKRIFRESRR